MEPILSKQEIADLLQTLQKGDSGSAGHQIGRAAGLSPEAHEINLFDLLSERTGTPEIPNFDIIIDLFSSFFSSSLSYQLQRSVTLKVLNAESKPFKDYFSEENQHYTTGILGLKPLKSGALITYDPQLSFALIEILLGGIETSNLSLPDRGASKLERFIHKSSMTNACYALERAFQPILPISSKVIRVTSDPRLVSLADPESMVVVYLFEVVIDDISAHMELVVPTHSLEPCRESLTKLTRQPTFESKQDSAINLTNVVSMPVTLMAQVCSFDLTVKQLIDLQIDAVIPLDDYPGDRVNILVEGVPKFTGRLEQQNQRTNVHILKIL